MNIHNEAQAVKRLIEFIREQIPYEPDDQFLADNIEGETNFMEVASAFLDEASEIEALAEALAAQIADMTERKARLVRRGERLREMLKAAMEEAGINKLTLPRFTVSVREAPAKVIITNAETLPDLFVRVKREPDKKAIKEALERGEAVSGAELSNGGITMTVRTK